MSHSKVTRQRYGRTVALLAVCLCLPGASRAQVFGNGKVCWDGGAPCQEELSGPGSAARERRTKGQSTNDRPAKGPLPGTRVSTSEIARTKAPASTSLPHKVAIQVSQNDKAAMDVALNNVRNITEYYKQKGETVAIEVVTYGPGLHMLRADTSPVKDRIAPMALENPSVAFIACGNTQANQSKAEGKPVALVSEAKLVPSGVVRLMELQTQGYAYIRP